MDSLLSTLQRKLEAAPPWLALAGAAVFGVVALVAVYRVLFGTKSKANGLLSFLSEMGPHGKLALAGTIVSVYGLWGFGRETGDLPWPIRLAFVTMFDVIELSLFGALYKKSRHEPGQPAPKWTKGMKVMHYTAWGLVAFSVWANVVHAPNLASAPFMALMPAGAAWVVELELRDRMAGQGVVEESSTGPLKLLAALWRRWWAEKYAALGVDPTGRDSDSLVKAASARRAARQLFVLRQLLEQAAKNVTVKVEQGRAQRRTALKLLEELQEQRDETRQALERASFGTDSQQALAVFRGLAGWTRQDDIAMVNTADSPRVEELMEQVAIMPSARKLEAAGHAAAAEAARQEAERARQELEDAKAEVEAAKKEAEKAKADAEKAETEAEQKGRELAAAALETNRARQEAEAARAEAKAARQEAETEMSRLSSEADTLRQRVSEAAESVTAAEQKRKELEAAGLDAVEQKNELDEQIRGAAEKLAGLQRALDETEGQRRQTLAQVSEAKTEAERLEESLAALRTRAEQEDAKVRAHAERAAEAEENGRKAADRAAEAVAMADRLEVQVREAELALDDLRLTIRAELPEEELEGLDLDGIAFPGSTAKQEAWEEYLSQVTNGRPTLDAKQLSERYPVSESRAREWRVHFRGRRLRMIAAEAGERTPGGAERAADGAERGGSPAERAAEGGRAASIPAPVPPIDPGVFAAHRTTS
ncbi:hypothetical protein F7Q99_38950 [Streptomyces kaniharaensis]|uniref:DUF2637 domain-containing protein n=1 Tax=Streptomyces kaniharaensis TaxID=212423 RepID=A0A6N7L2C6_9ACTN|nr:hypothetical protein [Streptomyces kaniharaensis]MQS18012.1 hypothetical protein [Streptomyces kaniharaensis]